MPSFITPAIRQRIKEILEPHQNQAEADEEQPLIIPNDIGDNLIACLINIIGVAEMHDRRNKRGSPPFVFTLGQFMGKDGNRYFGIVLNSHSGAHFAGTAANPNYVYVNERGEKINPTPEDLTNAFEVVPLTPEETMDLIECGVPIFDPISGVPMRATLAIVFTILLPIFLAGAAITTQALTAGAIIVVVPILYLIFYRVWHSCAQKQQALFPFDKRPLLITGLKLAIFLIMILIALGVFSAEVPAPGSVNRTFYDNGIESGVIGGNFLAFVFTMSNLLIDARSSIPRSREQWRIVVTEKINGAVLFPAFLSLNATAIKLLNNNPADDQNTLAPQFPATLVLAALSFPGLPIIGAAADLCLDLLSRGLFAIGSYIGSGLAACCGSCSPTCSCRRHGKYEVLIQDPNNMN